MNETRTSCLFQLCKGAVGEKAARNKDLGWTRIVWFSIEDIFRGSHVWKLNAQHDTLFSLRQALRVNPLLFKGHVLLLCSNAIFEIAPAEGYNNFFLADVAVPVPFSMKTLNSCFSGSRKNKNERTYQNLEKTSALSPNFQHRILPHPLPSPP